MTKLVLNALNAINMHAHNRTSAPDKDFRLKKIVGGKEEYFEYISKVFEDISNDFVSTFSNVKDKRIAWAILKSKTKEWKHFIQTEMGTDKNCLNNHLAIKNRKLPEHFKEELFKDFFSRHKDKEDVKNNTSRIWLSAAKNSYHLLFRVPEKPLPDSKDITPTIAFAADSMKLDKSLPHLIENNAITKSEEHRPIILKEEDPSETSENNSEDIHAKVDIKYVDYTPLESLESYIDKDQTIASYLLDLGEAIHKNDVDKLQDNPLFKIFTRHPRYYEDRAMQPIGYYFLQLRRLVRENKKDNANKFLEMIQDEIEKLENDDRVDISDHADRERRAEHYHETALKISAENGAPTIVHAYKSGFMDSRIQSKVPFFY